MWQVYLIKTIHIIIVIINILAVPVLLVTQSIFISVPVATVLIGLSTNDSHYCVLTRLENHYRAKAGLAPLKMFLDDIIIKLWRR